MLNRHGCCRSSSRTAYQCSMRRFTARASSAGLLGVVPIELEGGHSPFLARPEQLAHEMDKLALS